jgi:hypothetical protein
MLAATRETRSPEAAILAMGTCGHAAVGFARFPKLNRTLTNLPRNLPDRPTQIAILKSGLTETESHGATTPWLSLL